MKLDYSHMLEMVSADAQVILDVAVEWDKGAPTLRVDDVLDSTGKVSLFRADRLWCDMACAIIDAAEDDERLLERAVERDVLEREAA